MQNCLLEEAKESWISGLYHHVFLYLKFTFSSTGVNHMNLPWKWWGCQGSHPFRIQDSGEHCSMSTACTLPLSLNVLTPLNWVCSLPWNRKSCSGERGITPFRNISHPARAGKEKNGEKKKEITEDSQLCCSTKEYSCSFWDPYGKLKINWFALWIFNSEVKQLHV